MISFFKILIFIFYLLSSFFYISHFFTQKEEKRNYGRKIFITVFLIHSIFLLLLIIKLGYIPFSTGLSALSFSGYIIAFSYIILTFFTKRDTFSFLIIPFITVTQFLNIFTLGFAHPLKGVFSSRWFQIHVSFALLSFSLFMFSFISGVLYLMLYRELSRKHFGKFYFSLNSLDELTKSLIHSTFLGLFFLVFAIYTGHMWLEDVKVLVKDINTRVYASYFTFLIYLIVVLLRIFKKVSGKKLSLLSILGFFLMIIAFAFGGKY